MADPPSLELSDSVRPVAGDAFGKDAWLSPKMGMGISVLTSVCGVLPVFLTGALALEIRSSIGLSVDQLGIAVSLFYLSAALSSALAGRMVQRRGARRGLIASLTASMLSCFFIAAVVNSTVLLMIPMVIGGLSNSLAAASTTLLIAETVPLQRRGIAFGIRQSSIPVAVALAGLAVPVLALTLGWRWAFGLAASATFIGLVGLSLLSPTSEASRSGENFRVGISYRSLLLLGAGVGFASMAISSMAAFFVESAVKSGIALETAGVLLAFGSALGISFRLIGGWVADGRQMGRLTAVAVMLLFGAAGMCLMAIGSSFWIFPAILLAFGPGFGWPGLYNLAVVAMNPDAPARASGITQTGAYLGGALGPLLFGLAASRLGYSWAWYGAAGCSALGACALLATKLSIRRSLSA